MSTVRTRLLCCASAVIVAVAATSGASAQDAATAKAENAAGQAISSADQSMGDIVVTAQKRSERLRDVPMSITAAGAEALQSRGVVDTADLVKITPGFSAQTGSYGIPIYYIRGVGFYDTTLGVSPAVTVYVDQAPLAYSTMGRGAVLDLERVEILKGPQGTLFGQNSTGGAINYIAAKPTDTLEAGFKLTVGRFDQVDAEAYLSGPISDTLSARLAVRREYRGTWQQNYINGEQIGRKEFTNARLIVDFNPTDTMRFELSASGWRDRSDSQIAQFLSYDPIGTRLPTQPIASFPAAPRNSRAAAWDAGERFQRDDSFYQFALRGDIDISDSITLTSLTSYAKNKVNVPLDFDSTSLPIDLIATIGTIKSFSQELRLSGEAGSALKWMVGANYQRDTVDEVSDFPRIAASSNAIGPFEWDSFANYNYQKVKTAGIFASADLKLSDTITVQGSARYTDQKRDFQGCTADRGAGDLAAAFSFFSSIFGNSPPTIAPGSCITLSVPQALPLPIVTGKLDEDNLAWRASVNWKPTTGTLFYANVTRGYKAGSFPTLPAAFADQLKPVPQESILAYEAGTKFDLADRKIQIEAAGFYYDYTDKQLLGYRPVFPFGNLPGLVTIPKSRVVGAEANVTLLPVDELRLSLAGTFVDTKVRSDPPNPTGPFGSLGSFVGESFPVTPRWQGSADAEYRFAVSGGLDAFLGGSVTARSRTQAALFNGTGASAVKEQQLVIPGYALLDLRAGLSSSEDGWRLELWGRNVTNKFYVNNISHNSDYVFQFTGMPATYGITLSYNFGG